MDVPELTGRALVEIDGAAAPGSWIFRFGEDYVLSVGCTWRIVALGRVVLAGEDHQQLFGLKEPVDAVAAATSYLKDRPITGASIDETGDVTLTFEGGTLFQTFTDSSGYESCTIHLGPHRQLIVVGGGEVVEF
jgi:hypothetical protein